MKDLKSRSVKECEDPLGEKSEDRTYHGHPCVPPTASYEVLAALPGKERSFPKYFNTNSKWSLMSSTLRPLEHICTLMNQPREREKFRVVIIIAVTLQCTAG